VEFLANLTTWQKKKEVQFAILEKT
jgi:hypothetical protein